MPTPRRKRILACSILALCGMGFEPTRTEAQTRVWTPATNDWNTAGNWTAADVPDTAAESAEFGVSAITNPTNAGAITINGITFAAGASTYTINNTGFAELAGTGISNLSAATQTLNNSLFGSTLFFTNAASIGTGVVVTNAGFVTFDNTASAGTGTVTNTNSDGLVNFIGTATGSSATLNNAGSGVANGSTFVFSDNATAGGATINNSGNNALVLFSGTAQGGTATISNTGAGAKTQFSANANAGNAAITNGANTATIFNNSASAGSATIVSSGAFSSVSFNNTSTGGNANITLSGNLAIGEFKNSATAGNATINLNNATALLNFFDSAQGGTATINNTGNSATFPGSLVGFYQTSNAQNALIRNNQTNTQTLFSDTATAGSASIFNNGVNSNTQFVVSANAGTSTIRNVGTGSSIGFAQNANAGTSTIISGSANTLVSFIGNSTANLANITLSGNLASGEFKNAATASGATITLSNATALLSFFDTAKGGTANINNAGASGTFPGSVVGFFNSSDAQTATINNSAQNAQTLFSDTSTANGASITNNGTDSNTQFTVSASAGNATIRNIGTGSSIGFAQNTTAGTSTLISSGDATLVSFIGSSTANLANITLSGNLAIGEFKNSATAGDATITLSNGTALLSFFDTTTAATSAINNNGSGAAFPSSVVGFFNNSTAGTSDITNSGQNSQTLFSNNATANAARIVNSGVDSNTTFTVSATAGTSNIANSGAGSSTIFGQTTSAGDSTIVNSGANSFTRFLGSSSAGTAGITNSGAGSRTFFAGSAVGGTVDITNANPTSGIDISALTASGVTIGSFQGNGSIFLGSKRLTAGRTNTDIAFTGIIRDGGTSSGVGGSLVKVGTGTWTLSGANTFSGSFDIQLGTVVVENPQALGLGNVQLSDGVLRGGTALAEMRVGGNYTQTGGELQLRIGGTGNDQHDRLVVAGSADLGGRLRLDTVAGYVPQTGDRIELVNTGGGVNGEFDTVQTSAPLVEGRVQYLANDVVLTFARAAFAEIARTPNQRSTAKALDQAVLAPGAVELLAFLDTLPIEALPGALDLLAPEALGALFSISRSAANAQAFTVLHRLDEIRAASRNDWMIDPVAGDKEMLDPVRGGTAKEMKEIMSEGPRLGVFVHGSGEFVNVGSTTNARGYDFDAGGVTIGMDYKVTPNFVAGFLANYTRSRIDLTRWGRIEGDSVRGGVYASVFGAGGYLTGYVGGGYNDYDTKRGGLLGQARGSTKGEEFNALVAAGYDAHIGGLTVGPIATYHYTYAETHGFRERGSLAPLAIRAENHQSSRTNVGLRVAYEIPMGGVTLTPEVRATWQHEFGDRAFATTSQFGFGGPDFTVHTPEIGRDTFVLNAGLTLQVSPMFGVHAYYYGDFGTSNYDSHNVFAGARLSF